MNPHNEGEHEAPTLKDVAELAHVHYTTASRALRGMPDIHAETALRVRAAASELGYSPNFNAQALKRPTNHRVAAVITDPISIDQLSRYSQPFWLAMLMGLTRHLAASQIGVIQVTSEATRLLETLPVKAMLLLSLVNQPIDVPLRLRDVPLVVERNHALAQEAVATIGHDHQQIAREACRYLASHNAKRVAYLPLSAFDNLSVAASQGYLGWCTEVGQQPIVIEPSADPDDQRSAVQAALQAGADGIYATTGELAPVSDAIRAEDLSCPDDVQVICIGEGVVERLLSPPLTSISLQGAQCAADIAQLLTKVINGEAVSDVTFTHRLVRRGSTRESSVSR